MMKRTVGLILLVILGVVGVVVLCLTLRAPKNDESWKTMENSIRKQLNWE